MKSHRRAGILVAVLAAIVLGWGHPTLGQTAAGTNALEWAVSVSRQFNAYAHDPVLPYVIGVAAERVKHDWLDLLKIPDAWRDPIIILVQAREGPLLQAAPVGLEIIPTGIHLKYQIRCVTPPALTESVLVPAVVEALCAEIAHRNQPVPRSQPFRAEAIPTWLVQGLAQSIQGRSDLLRVVARRSLAGGRAQPATDLLQASKVPADPLERELFEANAWLFVDSLLSLRNGPEKLLRSLAVLDTAGSATNAFWEVYGADFPKAVDLEKWWSVQLASRSALVVAGNLTAEDTTERLDVILATELSLGPSGTNAGARASVSLEQLAPYGDRKWLKPLLQNKLAALRALRTEAHPSYRETIALYDQAVQFLLTEKNRPFRRVLKQAETARRKTDEAARKISAYLDEAERIYEPQQWDTTFQGYFQTIEQFQLLDQRRRSTFSDYLDKFDK